MTPTDSLIYNPQATGDSLLDVNMSAREFGLFDFGFTIRYCDTVNAPAPLYFIMTASITVPADFICPLSQQIMLQPLMTRSGHHFERSAILAWLDGGNERCPITSERLKPSDLIPDRRLEALVSFWRENHGLAVTGTHQTVHQDEVFIGLGVLNNMPERTKTKRSSRLRRLQMPRVFRPSRSTRVVAKSA